MVSSETDKTVLGKAFRILDAFTAERSTLSLAALSERTGLPKSTVHRVARTLVEWDALDHVENEYRLGLHLFELGALVPRWRSLQAAALPFMQDLFQTTNETVNLATLDGIDVIYLQKIHGHRRSIRASRVGGRWPPHSTALGKVLMAFSDPSLTQVVLQRGLKPLTPYTIMVADVLLEQLEDARRTGVAREREESVPGFQCIAAPILDHQRRALGAISVSVPTSRDLELIGPAVRTAAAGITRTISTAH